MAEIVNLRMARKARARAAKEAEAAEKRALHGRSKAVRTLAEAEKARVARELDGKKRD
nr:DUF4169 family protein [Sphingomonas vulcanisoli]